MGLLKPDIVEGAAAIAEVLGQPKRRVDRLISLGQIPTFRLHPGSRMHCAERSALIGWLARRAATAGPRS